MAALEVGELVTGRQLLHGPVRQVADRDDPRRASPRRRPGRCRMFGAGHVLGGLGDVGPRVTVSRSVVIRSASWVVCGSSPSATRFTRSRSVTMPARRSPSSTMTEEIPLSCSRPRDHGERVLRRGRLHVRVHDVLDLHRRSPPSGNSRGRSVLNGRSRRASRGARGQWSERPLKLKDSTLSAGTREAEKKNSLASSVSRPIIVVLVSASRIDWVNRKFLTGMRDLAVLDEEGAVAGHARDRRLHRVHDVRVVEAGHEQATVGRRRSSPRARRLREP